MKRKGRSGRIGRRLTELWISDPIEGCDHEVARSDFEESRDGDLLDR